MFFKLIDDKTKVFIIKYAIFLCLNGHDKTKVLLKMENFKSLEFGIFIFNWKFKNFPNHFF